MKAIDRPVERFSQSNPPEEWGGRRVAYFECESFEEFCTVQSFTMNRDNNYGSVWSRQAGLGPWYIAFTHGGPCGGESPDCLGFVPTTGHYLCPACRGQ